MIAMVVNGRDSNIMAIAYGSLPKLPGKCM